MQTARLFEIIYILLNKKTVTAKELASQLNVSTRTIYRDIDVLSLARIPVYTEKGKGGGISLLPGFVLSKSILSEQEQHEILSALQGLSYIRAEDTGQTLQKLSAVFDKTAANWLDVDFSDWSFQGDEVFDSFKAAILERRIVEFDYFSSYGKKTFRRIEPIQLWFKSRAWYVKGFCLMRKEIRIFKLVRVRELMVTSETFNERNLLVIQPDESESTENIECETYIRMKIAPEMTYRVLDEFDWDSAELQPDGSHIVSIWWPEDEWVYGKILSFGAYAEVLEPERIRKIIKAKAKGIFDKY